MSAARVLAEARAAGLALQLDGETIRLSASVPPSPELIERIRAHKPAMVALLRGELPLPEPANSDPAPLFWAEGRDLAEVEYVANIMKRALLATNPALIEPGERPWWGTDEPSTAADHERAEFAAELAELEAWLAERKAAEADPTFRPAKDLDFGPWLSPAEWLRRSKWP